MYYKKFEINEKGNDYVCPDIHGCFSIFEKTLNELNFDVSVDRLFVLGDLIDRGPESHKVLKYLEQPWFNSILGNHELLCIWSEFYTRWDRVWKLNGGDWITEQNIPNGFLRELRDKLAELPLIIELTNSYGKQIGLVHAEIYQDWNETIDRVKTITTEDLWSAGGEYQKHSLLVEQLVWLRQKVKLYCHKDNDPETIISNIDFVLHGHTICSKDIQIGNCFYLDRGCYRTDFLNIVNIDNYT